MNCKLLLVLAFTGTCYFGAFAQKYYVSPTGKTHHLSGEELNRLNEIGKNFQATDPPSGVVRNIAEFEPCEAVLITYNGGFGIPISSIKEMSQDIMVTTIVASTSQRTQVLNQYNSNNVNTSNCNFLLSPSDSWWTRDYGPWYISIDNSHIAIIDFPYNRPRPNDDEIPKKMATFLNIPWYGMNVTATGGNYMCDGIGIAASTELTWEENTSQTHAQIAQKFHDYLGIQTYHVLQDPLGDYIKHIDCWGKFLDVDKVLIAQTAANDPRYEDYEAVAAYFSEHNCSYGYPYHVFRVYEPGDFGNDVNPYTNSLILNNKVFVPKSGSTWDDEALALYQEAMPGYEIIGVQSSGWYNTDALHCRTYGVADRRMIRIEHIPLRDTLLAESGSYKIIANIYALGGNLIDSLPILNYKVNDSIFIPVAMTLDSANHYSALIPEQKTNSHIAYYISASDTAGRTFNHPYIGEPDPHIFIAGLSTVGIETQNTPGDLYFNIYPNPSQGVTFVWVEPSRDENIKIQVVNLSGRIVYQNTFDCIWGENLLRLPLDQLPDGIYALTVKTKAGVYSKKLVMLRK